VNQSQQFFGNDWFLGHRALALSADGSILAAGATRHNVDGIPNAGTVYVYRRIQNVWSLMTTLRAPNPSFEDSFGTSVDMSLDGRTLKISSVNPRNDFNIPQFRSHIFVRPANTWRYSVTIEPSIPNDECYSTRLSGDGQTIVSSCVTRATNSPHIVTTKRAGDAWVHVAELPVSFYHLRQPIALNANATLMALFEGEPGFVGLYRWLGGNWVRDAGISRPGWDLAFNHEGNLLAVSDFGALESGPGVSPVVMPGTATLGAVYVYQHDDTTNNWTLRNVVKSANPGFRDWFGRSVSLSASGRTLAVGAPGENSNATGIDGVRQNEDAQNAGAAYLY
jgi:trimeric autotransporter adhesin